MKKATILFSIILLFSFNEPDPKTYKFEFNDQEINLVYEALGKMPAEQVESLRARIRIEWTKQNPLPNDPGQQMQNKPNEKKDSTKKN